LYDRVIVSIMSGKLSFHDWKSLGILPQKTCGNPEYLLSALLLMHLQNFAIFQPQWNRGWGVRCFHYVLEHNGIYDCHQCCAVVIYCHCCYAYVALMFRFCMLTYVRYHANVRNMMFLVTFCFCTEYLQFYVLFENTCGKKFGIMQKIYRCIGTQKNWRCWFFRTTALFMLYSGHK